MLHAGTRSRFQCRISGERTASGGSCRREPCCNLRSMTQGRGSFTCKFIRYEEAPGNVQQKVIEEAKALAEAE